MILELILGIGLTCGPTKFINHSGDRWNLHDYKVMATAVYRCKYGYTGCLKKFIKKEPLVFHAVCGRGSSGPGEVSQ